MNGNDATIEDFRDIILSNGYEINFLDPTRISYRSVTCTDNILTNANYGKAMTFNVDSDLSHHNALFYPYLQKLVIVKRLAIEGKFLISFQLIG